MKKLVCLMIVVLIGFSDGGVGAGQAKGSVTYHLSELQSSSAQYDPLGNNSRGILYLTIDNQHGSTDIAYTIHSTTDDDGGVFAGQVKRGEQIVRDKIVVGRNEQYYIQARCMASQGCNATVTLSNG